MRLIDLDQKVIVPINDERYGTTYEVQMTVAEIFDKFLEGNKPVLIDAIPVKWMNKMRNDERTSIDDVEIIDTLLCWWENDKEAQQ